MFPNPEAECWWLRTTPRSPRALSAILQKQGWDVSTAATVADGIRMLAIRPDHVIIDLMLPDGDGAQILEHANAANIHPHMTVTTGVSDSDHLDRVRQWAPRPFLLNR